jgi:hypothetical protein
MAVSMLGEAAREIGAGAVVGLLCVALPVILHSRRQHRLLRKEIRDKEK